MDSDALQAGPGPHSAVGRTLTSENYDSEPARSEDDRAGAAAPAMRKANVA